MNKFIRKDNRVPLEYDKGHLRDMKFEMPGKASLELQMRELWAEVRLFF